MKFKFLLPLVAILSLAGCGQTNANAPKDNPPSGTDANYSVNEIIFYDALVILQIYFVGICYKVLHRAYSTCNQYINE